jgi:hypothetical protein
VLRALAPLALAATLAACGPKLVRETVYDTEIVKVELRHRLEDGKPVPHGYEHPASIAGVRLAHILASVAHESKPGERQPTIRSEHVYELADGLAAAFARAGPDDEVVALARMRDRRLQIFTVDRVTVFRAWLASGQLWLEFMAIEEQLDHEQRSKGYDIPTEVPTRAPSWKLVPGTSVASAGPRGVQVDWRADHWRKPLDLTVRGGRARRRTILMETQEEEVAPTPLPADATDAQLRALDQLDAARRAGLVSEGEYQRRRRLILEGRLDEAGYGSSP